MKKLLATTALCLVFSTGITSTAQADTTAPTINIAQITLVNTAHHVRLPEMDLYRGDFQRMEKPALQNTLYTGAGSALMTSIRNYVG